ncbi:MAG: cell wall-active antibiotics response protein LiaF [Sporolactobacillus sp.]|jgi:lia operon protein LiaF|nr:cell wall-active antibiotics response protein LiaF [Sporolactobacillus sp.]
MSAGKILAALAIVMLGVYWLLDSLGLISSEIMPAIGGYVAYGIVCAGILLLFVPLFHRRRPNFFWGFFFLIYGGLLIAGRHDLLTFGWTDIWKLWPYLIIYFGLGMLLGDHLIMSPSAGFPRHGRHKVIRIMEDGNDFEEQNRPNGHETWHKDGHKKAWNTNSFVRESHFKHDNWMVKPMNENVRIADYNFDFTKAFIPEETIPITLRGWVGDIKITVPDDLAYRVDLKAKVGDAKIGGDKQSGVLRDITYQTGNYDDATRKIAFSFDFQVIDLTIDRV